MKTPIAKTGDDKGSETEGGAAALPTAETETEAEAPKRRGPGSGGSPKARALRVAERTREGDNVTALGAGRQGKLGPVAAARLAARSGQPVELQPTPPDPTLKRLVIQPDNVLPGVVESPSSLAAPDPGVQGLKKPAKLPVTPAEAVPRPISTVQAAKLQTRHYVLMALFALLVLLPPALYGTYLYTVAVDQYESDVGFGSRTEQASNTFDILGVLGGSGGGASTNDMDILNQFVTSQELVSRVDAKLDLRKIWSRHPEDWVFSFPQEGPIEELVDYWNKMVVVNYDNSTGLMSLEVFAFTPEDAQAIAREILAESGDIINDLSKTAQEDTTRYSRDTLAKAESRYRKAQSDLAEFRIKNRIVDPQLQLNGATQIVNGLVQQMAEAQINVELLRGQVSDSDPRIAQLTRRIEIIQKRIAEESAKVGSLGDTSDPGYANLIRDYQNLQLEMEFAQKSYLAAQGAYDQALSDAQQQTHYLATFLEPTVAQSSTAPDRPLHILLTALAGLLAWSSISMIYYALRDRR